VGLLNIGEEDTKGNSAVKQAHEYFKNSALNFVGNVEGRDLFGGKAEVVVCDGFVGNICLKLTEGLAQGINSAFLDELDSTLVGRAGVKFLRGKLRAFRRRIDYASYGGAPLLGINGVAFVCHGASTPEAIASALGAAADSVDGELVEYLEEGLARYRGLLLGRGTEA
jgi:glycerol-3-phosphate acyltransferase PlsX